MAQRGRPFEAGNKFGKGRPRGSRNKTTIAAQELLNSYSEPILRKALVDGATGGGPAVACIPRSGRARAAAVACSDRKTFQPATQQTFRKHRKKC